MTDWQAVIDGTWPAERMLRQGGWTLRITPGAGGRVNALSGTGDVAEAEAFARDHGSRPSFVIWPEAETLDAELGARGYAIEDAVWIWQVDARNIAGDPLPHATAMTAQPPLAIMRDLWEGGGIGAARQAVMNRAPLGTGVLGRIEDRAAGVAFVSIHAGTAMLHALEVAPRFRRKGVARYIIRAAAHWAAKNGAGTLSLVVTRANPANKLYESMGMARVGRYHYRRAPEGP